MPLYHRVQIDAVPTLRLQDLPRPLRDHEGDQDLAGDDVQESNPVGDAASSCDGDDNALGHLSL